MSSDHEDVFLSDFPVAADEPRPHRLQNLTSEDSSVVNTTSAADGDSDYFYQVEQLTFLWVLFTLIVIGNSIVLVGLSMSKGRKSRMNFFIKNLAAADLCVGLISVLTDIIWRITITWEAGEHACKVIRFSQGVVTYASTYVLVALSIDRYDAITHPMNFTGSWRRAKALVIVAWALSFVFAVPILILYHTKEIPEYGMQCWIELEQWQWRLYITLVALTLFIIPAFLIAGCYIIIVITIWKKGKDMGNHVEMRVNGKGSEKALLNSKETGDKDEGGSTGAAKKRRRRPKLRLSKSTSKTSTAAATDEVESRRASSRGLIPKAKVKTVKMTFVIIFVFILCWSPYFVFDLLQVYGCIPDTKTFRAIATFVQSLAPLNSAANPLIYCLFSTNAGQNFCNWIGCCGKKGPANSGANGGAGGKNPRQKKAAFNGPGVNSSRQDNSHRSAQTTKSASLAFDSSATTTTTSTSGSSGNGISARSVRGARGGGISASASGGEDEETLLTNSAKGVSWSTKAEIAPIPKSHQRF